MEFFFSPLWVWSKVEQINRLVCSARGDAVEGDFTRHVSLLTPTSLTGVTLIRLCALFPDSHRGLRPSAWLLCSGSLTGYAEQDHFLRHPCLWTSLFHPVMDSSNSQHLRGIAFPALMLMDVPTAQWPPPPLLKLSPVSVGTVFGVLG